MIAKLLAATAVVGMCVLSMGALSGCEPGPAHAEKRPEIDEIRLRKEADEKARRQVTPGNVRAKAKALEKKIKAELR